MNNLNDKLINEWESCIGNQRLNLIEKCLKLAQIIEYPNLDISNEVQKLNNLGVMLKNSITENKNQTYLISLLNEFIFQKCGFYGDLEDYYNPKNNFLNHVIDEKHGIPITLSIIYAELARYIGLELRIIGFPSHVIVEGGEEIILDPFNKGRLLSENDLQEILYRNYGENIDLLPEYLTAITTEQILIRILRNLKSSYTESYSYEKAIFCNKMILSIIPESTEEIRDNGILEKKMSHFEKAVKYLNRYLELEPNAEDVDFVLELIRKIREKINYL